jgi:hypothetical protein
MMAERPKNVKRKCSKSNAGRCTGESKSNWTYSTIWGYDTGDHIAWMIG